MITRKDTLKVLFMFGLFCWAILMCVGAFDIFYYGMIRNKTVILIICCYATPILFGIIAHFRSWFE